MRRSQRELIMKPADLLSEMLHEGRQDAWENERTPTPLRRFELRLHTTGLSIRKMVGILELLGVDRSHSAVWNWVYTLSEAQQDLSTTQPSRVAVEEKQIEIGGEKKWLYAAVDVDSKLLIEVDVFSRRGTTPRRRSCIASLRNTALPTQRFALMLAAV